MRDNDRVGHLEFYEYVVEHPDNSADDAAEALGITLAEVAAARDTLVHLHLLQPIEPDGTYSAVSPDVAAADSVHDDLVRISELTQVVERVRAELASVEPRYTAARRRRLQTYTPVELVEDPAAVRRLIRNSTTDCRKWAYILHPNAALRAESHRASAAYDRDMRARGIDRRNIYHEGVLTSAATRRSVAELAPLGVQFRILPVVPIQALIYDDDLAVVSRMAGPGDKAAIVIRDPAVVGVVLLVYRTLWDMARPFPLDEPDQPAQTDELSDQRRKILQGLAAGYTDESIARRLGVHVRTLRRHISDLSAQAGADTRFQLAIRARDQHWI